MLFIRMTLYALSAGAAGYGLASFDPTTGLLTLDINEAAQVIGGVLTFAATFWASRVAKARGGKT